MRLAAWSKVFTALAIGVGSVVGLSWVFMGHSSSQPTPRSDDKIDGHPINADALEREVRRVVQLGSSLAAVQDSLAKIGLGTHFEAGTKTLYAIAHKLQGSTLFASKSLAFKFHFDDRFALRSIEAEVIYTGP